MLLLSDFMKFWGSLFSPPLTVGILRSAKRMADQRRDVRTDPVSGYVVEMWLWHNLCPLGYLRHQQYFGQGLCWQLTLPRAEVPAAPGRLAAGGWGETPGCPFPLCLSHAWVMPPPLLRCRHCRLSPHTL